MAETMQFPHLEKDSLAATISDMWVRWNTDRKSWMDDKEELRGYIFATDTRKTTNAQLPWKNSTVTPKLTQIRDNLHANYMAALFPNDNWFVWVAADRDAASLKKRDAIESFMRSKLRASDFETIVSQLVYDYIDYGNALAGHEFVNNVKKDPMTQEEVVVYRGPRAFRVSPLDFVMDVTASTFDNAPMIRRTLKTIGDVKRDIETKPQLNYNPSVFNKMMEVRQSGTRDYVDFVKSKGLIVDGFASIEQYLGSGTVELLEFRGDVFDASTGEIHSDKIITIVDRMWVLRDEVNPSWIGSRPYKHVGWRLRPDNLWAQGPLDQLVGMQYRIDHLENLKADVFDQIAHPITKIKGTTVEDFKFGPGQEVHCGDDGDVEFLRPDSAALNADMEIQTLMNRMEELAGAPREAMGIRTPGEKTKYEMQVLENGAGRIFQSKVNWFERNLLEPLLNSMFEEARRQLAGKETIEVKDEELGTSTFIDITKEDLKANGKLAPMGARHFAEQAKFVQELTQTLGLLQNNQSVAVHISGKGVAKALEDVMGWKPYRIVRDNVAIFEAAETERVKQAAQEQVQAEGVAPSELQSQDYVPPKGANPNEQSATETPPQGTQ